MSRLASPFSFSGLDRRCLRGLLKAIERTLLRVEANVRIGSSTRPNPSGRPTRFAHTSQPFEGVTPRSTIPSVKRDFNGGRAGRSARRIESTLSCQEASERLKTTIEARQRRLILGRRRRIVRGLAEGWAIAVSDRGTLNYTIRYTIRVCRLSH
jgi:hypothetical protein